MTNLMSGIAADEPQTDRELLLQIHSQLQHLNQKIEGSDGICAVQKRHDTRLGALENWRWYALGAVSILTFVLVSFGRYIDLGGAV